MLRPCALGYLFPSAAQRCSVSLARIRFTACHLPLVRTDNSKYKSSGTSLEVTLRKRTSLTARVN